MKNLVVKLPQTRDQAVKNKESESYCWKPRQLGGEEKA
jgi:hypothetical protein